MLSINHLVENQMVLERFLSRSLVEPSLEVLLDFALELVLSQPWLAAEARGSIFLAEKNGRNLAMKAQRGLPESILHSCAIVPFGSCMCGLAAQANQVQFSDAIDDRHSITYNDLHDHGHYCIPISVEDEVLGVLNLCTKPGHIRKQFEEGFLLAMADIIAGVVLRKRAEEYASRADLSYKGLINTVEGIVWEADFDTKGFTFVSKQAEKILGYAVTDWLTQPSFWTDHMHPDDATWVPDACARAAAEKSIYRIEYRMFHENGNVVWLDDVISVITDKADRKKLRGILVDITEKKRTEEELRKARRGGEEGMQEGGKKQNEQRLRAIIDALPDLLLVVDRHGLVEEVSVRAVETQLFSAEDVVGSNLRDYISFDTIEGVFSKIDDCLQTGEVQSLDFSLHSPNESFAWFDARIAPFGTDSAVMILRNVSEKRHADAEKEHLLHDLGERVKELKCMYGLSKLAEQSSNSLEEIMLGLVNIMPLSWRYPDITHARILYGEKEFYSDGYAPTHWVQSSDLKVRGRIVGKIEVLYDQKRPDRDEGPFLREERDLIDALAERLGSIIEGRDIANELYLKSAALESAANAVIITDQAGIITWVNRSFSRLTGYAPHEVRGAKPSILKSGKHDGDFYHSMWETISAGAVWRGQMTNRKKDGSTYVEEMTITPVWQSDGGDICHYVAVKEDVTERKKIELAVRQSEEKYRSLFEYANDSIFIIDASTGRFVDFNKNAHVRLGYTRRKLLGMTVADIGDIGALDTTGQSEEKPNRGNTSVFEHVHIKKDETRVPVEISSHHFFYGDKRMTQSIVRDITERKWAEKELQFSNRLLEIGNRHTAVKPMIDEYAAAFRDFTDCDAVGIRLIDQHGEYPYQASFGYKGGFFEDKQHLSVRSEHYLCNRVVTGKVESGFPFKTEFGSCYVNDSTSVVQKYQKNKTRFCLMCQEFGYETVALVPIKSSAEVIGLIHVAYERKNMLSPRLISAVERASLQLNAALKRATTEEALRQSEDELKAIYTGMVDGVLIVDSAEGRILRANSAICRMLGYEEAELLSLSVDKIHPSDWEEASLDIYRGVVEGDIAIARDVPCLQKNGSVFFADIGSNSIRYRGNRVQIGFYRDVTERKRNEEMLQQMAAGMAHEIRNPLSAIATGLDLLNRRKDKENSKLYRGIREESLRLQNILTDFLGFARAYSPEYTEGDINFILQEVTSIIGNDDRFTDRRIELDLTETMPKVFFDRERIRQVHRFSWDRITPKF